MRRRLLTAMAVLIAALAAASSARALEVVCIEASRYKHLYQLFGGDRSRFAAYFQLDPSRLPSPEHCRAALVSGGIVLNSGDIDKLVDIVLRNQGWLAELYLASSGGSIAEGLRLGFLVRAFWLKSRTVTLPKGRAVTYAPDFAIAPLPANQAAPSRLPGERVPAVEGWQAFTAAIKALPPQYPASPGCMSACGLMHTAGIDRQGDVFVHRPRYNAPSDPARAANAPPPERAPTQTNAPPTGAPQAAPPPRAGSRIDTSRSMSETDHGLRRSEELNIAFYQQMDAGADFIRIFQATSTLTTTPAATNRFPRFVADFLAAKCETDAEQLLKLDLQLRVAIEETSARSLGIPLGAAPLRQALTSVRERRLRAEQCVAAAHERERLAAFDKQCGRVCDLTSVIGTTSARLRELRERVNR